MDNKNSESDNGSAFEKFVDWMEKGINPDIDPCEDFFGYACGRINEENYDKSLGEYPPPRFGDGFERIFENETINCSLIRKTRDFYNSLPTEHWRVLQDDGVIEFCGGFPAFQDTWTSENFNWIKAAAILNAVELDTILSCSVEYLDDKKIILVSALSPDDEEIENIEEKLRKFEISEEKIWDIVNDVNEIKEQLDRITNDSDESQYQRIRKTFQELREDEFDYQTYFESYLGQPLSDDDVFHLNYDEPGHLDRFLNVFAEASPRAVANFITFRALYEGDWDRSNWRRWLTLRRFAPIIFSVGFNTYWSETEQGKRNQVLQIVRNSYERYEKPEIDDPSDIQHTLFNRDEEVLEYIKSHFQYQQIRAEYEDLEISSNNFFQNIINIQNHEPPASIKKCYAYRYEEQDIYYVSKYFLEFFVNHHDKPILYYFSGFNAEKWENLCQIIMGIMEMKARVQDYDKIVENLRKQKKSFDPLEEDDDDDDEEDENIVTDVIHFWMRSYISAIVTLERTYEDYKTWLSENQDEARKQDQILQRLNLNSRKAFFVSFIQQYCFEEPEYRLSVILALSNSEEFAKEFQCKPDSRMNPTNKCKIKWKGG